MPYRLLQEISSERSAMRLLANKLLITHLALLALTDFVAGAPVKGIAHRPQNQLAPVALKDLRRGEGEELK
jgi:hypothetical protein